MANVHKLRKGARVAAVHGGTRYEGNFSAIIPARPTAAENSARRERFVLRNGPVVMYIPTENTEVRLMRGARST
jgi:hypothetical protein